MTGTQKSPARKSLPRQMAGWTLDKILCPPGQRYTHKCTFGGKSGLILPTAPVPQNPTATAKGRSASATKPSQGLPKLFQGLWCPQEWTEGHRHPWGYAEVLVRLRSHGLSLRLLQKCPSSLFLRVYPVPGTIPSSTHASCH